ncbi:hypothetical protein ACOMHN_010865 [Nucella lapillus]
MARIERKAHYIGTWREDHVTDSTMRQIIARSHAEKGQKVKVKLSKDGLNISRTVLFQENFLSSFPLSEVYFLTVNPHHPTCLLCIVADPVRKYLILALRTHSQAESQLLMDTFQVSSLGTDAFLLVPQPFCETLVPQPFCETLVPQPFSVKPLSHNLYV